MTKPTILVTGATGKTGGAVVTQLLAKGFPVRAVVRALDGRAEALRSAGAEVAVADLYDPDQLLDAMRGTQRAYYVAPITTTPCKARWRSRSVPVKRAWKPLCR